MATSKSGTRPKTRTKTKTNKVKVTKFVRFSYLVGVSMWQYRMELNIPQRALATRAKITQVKVSRAERGMPTSLATIDAAAFALGIPSSEILARAEYLGQTFQIGGYGVLHEGQTLQKGQNVMAEAEADAHLNGLAVNPALCL